MLNKKSHTPSPSFELLCQAILLDNPEVAKLQAEKIIATNFINWDDLLLRADYHCIKPQLGVLLSKLSPQIVPESTSKNLREANQQVLYRQFRNVAEFLEIKSLLEKEGIPAIPFKGFWLAHSLYGNLAARESVDIDLFIHLKDLERILPLMPGLGYQHETSSSPRFLEVVKKTSAEYNFDKFEGGERISHVEFHWTLGSSIHGLDISLNDLASQIIKGEMQNREFEVFSSSANLLLAVMHHGGKDPMIKMKQILDFGYFLTKCNDIDWAWVIKESRRFDMETPLYLGVKLASILTGAKIPEELKEKTETKKIAMLVQERIQAMAQDPDAWYDHKFDRKNLVFHLRTRKRLKTKWLMLHNFYYSRLIQFITPKFLLNIYLKKRYNINKD